MGSRAARRSTGIFPCGRTSSKAVAKSYAPCDLEILGCPHIIPVKGQGMDKIHPQLGKGLDRGAEPAQRAKGTLIPDCLERDGSPIKACGSRSTRCRIIRGTLEGVRVVLAPPGCGYALLAKKRFQLGVRLNRPLQA
jgi:hypothetical protein